MNEFNLSEDDLSRLPGLETRENLNGPCPSGIEINVLALVKGSERYIFFYTHEYRAEALRTLGRFANDPELSFTWYDASVLSQKIRHTSQEQEKEKQAPLAAANASSALDVTGYHAYNPLWQKHNEELRDLQNEFREKREEMEAEYQERLADLFERQREELEAERARRRSNRL